MKKFFIIILAFVAIFIICYTSIGEFQYETDLLFVKLLAHEDGLYCNPVKCIGIIHEYETWSKANLDYMEKYGPGAPGRPGELYHYNSDMHAYIRYIYK